MSSLYNGGSSSLKWAPWCKASKTMAAWVLQHIPILFVLSYTLYLCKISCKFLKWWSEDIELTPLLIFHINNRKTQPSSICRKCSKGQHLTNKCRSTKDRQGNWYHWETPWGPLTFSQVKSGPVLPSHSGEHVSPEN